MLTNPAEAADKTEHLVRRLFIDTQTYCLSCLPPGPPLLNRSQRLRQQYEGLAYILASRPVLRGLFVRPPCLPASLSCFFISLLRLPPHISVKLCSFCSLSHLSTFPARRSSGYTHSDLGSQALRTASLDSPLQKY